MELCFRVSQQIVALEEWVCRAKLLVQRSQQSHRWGCTPCPHPLGTSHLKAPVCVHAVTLLVWIKTPAESAPETHES